MKYEHEITIDVPLETAVQLFDTPDNEKYWRPEPISMEPLSGTPRQVGAKTRLKYKIGRREMELVETITARNLPEEFSGTYDADTMVNTIRHSFSSLGPEKTLYKTEVHYTFKSLMPKIMALLMPGFFKNQTYRYMKMFKDFAESKAGKLNR